MNLNASEHGYTDEKACALSTTACLGSVSDAVKTFDALVVPALLAAAATPALTSSTSGCGSLSFGFLRVTTFDAYHDVEECINRPHSLSLRFPTSTTRMMKGRPVPSRCSESENMSTTPPAASASAPPVEPRPIVYVSQSISQELHCSICLQPLVDPVTLPCDHSFCSVCIKACLATKQACPQCRAKAKETDIKQGI